MKAILPLLLCPVSTLLADSADFANFVRQTSYDDTAVQWDVQVEEAGSSRSSTLLGGLGSLYELWSVDTATGESITLDREFVSDYSPSVTMRFETGDPYRPVARTRVDQPLRLVISIDDPSANAAYKRLSIAHLGFLSEGDILTPFVLDDLAPQFSKQYDFDTAAEVSIEFPAATLAAANLTDTSGLETFAVVPANNNNGHGNNADDVDSSNKGGSKTEDPSGALDDETKNGGSVIVASVLDKIYLQVWPVADATLSGIDSNDSYQDIPAISVQLKNLYPDSSTYLRVYKGAPSSNPAEPITIGSAATVIRDTIPQDHTLVVEDLDEFLPDSGAYTIEVMHTTPFGTDILTQFYPLTVDFNVQVRGMVFTQGE